MDYTMDGLIPDADVDAINARARDAVTDHCFGVLREVNGEVRDLLAKALEAL